MTKVGSNIKKIRRIKNLSQQSFAELFNLNRGNISSYEENRAEPKIESIISIANYFSIPIEGLLTKDLTVNEILQYNADRLIEEEHKVSTLKIKEVPYINEDTLVKGLHEDISFEMSGSFPTLRIPDTSTQQLLAVQFNSNIIHHRDFEHYKSDDVLFFRSISPENIHLTEGKQGLYLQQHKLTFGKYEQPDQKGSLYFVLNDSTRVEVDSSSPGAFWKLFGRFQLES